MQDKEFLGVVGGGEWDCGEGVGNCLYYSLMDEDVVGTFEGAEVVECCFGAEEAKLTMQIIRKSKLLPMLASSRRKLMFLQI